MSGPAMAVLYGRCGSDPVLRQSSSGTAWATVNIAVQLDEAEGSAATWIGVRAFGRGAETLAKHTKGDLISVSGRFQLSRWRGQDGKDHEQFQLVADTVISAKSVRPGGGRKRGGQS